MWSLLTIYSKSEIWLYYILWNEPKWQMWLLLWYGGSKWVIYPIRLVFEINFHIYLINNVDVFIEISNHSNLWSMELWLIWIYGLWNCDMQKKYATNIGIWSRLCMVAWRKKPVTTNVVVTIENSKWWPNNKLIVTITIITSHSKGSIVKL